MGETSIQWTQNDDGSPGRVWNPTRGCSRTSPGCGGGTPSTGKNQGGCYAERQGARFCGSGMPFDGFVRLGKNGPRWTGKMALLTDKLREPLGWRKPTRVFVNSMSDLFHDGLSNEEIAAVFGVMAAARHHTFQILTKRAARMRAWFEWASGAVVNTDFWHRDYGVRLCKLMSKAEFDAVNEYMGGVAAGVHWPLPNVHLGVSVENQEYADERIEHLLATPAAIRFLSVEPQLGPIDLSIFIGRPDVDGDCTRCGLRVDSDGAHECPPGFGPRPDWIIQGGESGPGARPFDLAWARSMRDQCAAAGIPYFLKQLGANPREHVGAVAEQLVRLSDRKGGAMDEWEPALRIRQMPEARS
jgi:protein gp37